MSRHSLVVFLFFLSYMSIANFYSTNIDDVPNEMFSNFLRYMSIKNTKVDVSALIAHNSVSLQNDAMTDFQDVDNTYYSCEALRVDKDASAYISFNASGYNFEYCRCAANYFGRSLTKNGIGRCISCSKFTTGGRCAGNGSLSILNGYFPYNKDGSLAIISDDLSHLEQCQYPPACGGIQPGVESESKCLFSIAYWYPYVQGRLQLRVREHGYFLC
jgi:hypothetical protein